MEIHDFIRKYPSAVVRGTVPFGEIIGRLKEEYRAVDCLPDEIPHLPMHYFNAFHLPSNEKLQLRKEQLAVKAIRIPIWEKTLPYTKLDFVSQLPNGTGEDFIYLAYEEQVGYHYSNSRKLFLEVVLARGIPEYDIAHKTEDYTCYLTYLQWYLEAYMEAYTAFDSARFSWE